jgi:hypothetical protein
MSNPLAAAKAALAWRIERATSGRHLFGDARQLIGDYRKHFGRAPNLVNPSRFSEHMMRMMLTRDGRSELRARMTDKALVKDIIRERAGQAFVVPTIAVLRNMREVESYRFPDDCVVKPTHLSGQVIVRRPGDGPVDLGLIRRWFATNYYDRCREPAYRTLVPKVLVEERLHEAGHYVPLDYKVFCFRGIPAFIQVDEGRFIEHRRAYYSPSWQRLPFLMQKPALHRDVPQPAKLEEMLLAASRLSSGLSFLRVDFYALGERLAVGELTHFPEAGFTHFDPPEADGAAGRFFRNPELDPHAVFAGFAPQHPDHPVHKSANDEFLAPLGQDTTSR